MKWSIEQVTKYRVFMMKKIYSYLTLIPLLLSCQYLRAESVNINLVSFSGHPNLKYKNNDQMETIEIPKLVSEQGNKATDYQLLHIKLSSTSQFAVKFNGQLISPGESINKKVAVNDQGGLVVNLIPISEKFGKANFDLSIDEIYSELDITWEPYDPQISEWVPTGELREDSGWLPTLTSYSQPSSDGTQTIVQSRTYKEVFTHTIQNREKEKHSGEIRNSGGPYTENKIEAISSSRNITMVTTTTNGQKKCTSTTSYHHGCKKGYKTTDCTIPQNRTTTFQLNGNVLNKLVTTTTKTTKTCSKIHHAGKYHGPTH